MSIRVVQYNVLAPKLCDPEDFVKSVGHCDEEIRWERLLKKLSPEIERKSVITMQEVSRSWGGRFYTFFASKNYRFIYQGHGNDYSDFMGQAIAFHESFELLECHFLSPFCADSTNYPTVTMPEPISGYLPACLISASALAAGFMFPSKIGHIAKATLSTLMLSSLYFHYKGQQQPSKFHTDVDIRVSVDARSRDVIPMVKLRGSDDLDNVVLDFWVATNHMPCKFKNVPLMTVYTGLTMKAIQDVAKDDPYVLAGDFNQDPGTDAYRLLSEGSSAKLYVDVDEFLPVTKPMTSAYLAGAGSEPEYTNYCDRLMFGEYVGTLDYIWLSEHWEVTSVDPVPDIDTESWPSETEPSDHCLIAAELTLKDKFSNLIRLKST